MKVLLLFPPSWHPSQPYLSLPSLTAYLRKNSNYEILQRDLNIELLEILLSRKTCYEFYEMLIRKLKTFQIPSAAYPDNREIYNVMASSAEGLPAVMTEIENAKNVLRTEDFYDLDKYMESVHIINETLRFLSALFYPSVISALNNDMRYSVYSSQDILQALNDEGENIFHYLYNKYIISSIIDVRPNLVGISITSTSQIIPGLTIAKLLKDHDKEIHITIGGSVFTKLIEELKRVDGLFAVADSFIAFEGEHALLELAAQVEGKQEFNKVPNLIYRENGNTKVNEPFYAEDLNRLPTPDFDGLPLDLYFAPSRVLPVQMSRGCYYRKCAFCNLHLDHRNFRLRRTDLIMDDIKSLTKKYQTPYFFFTDESVPINKLREISQSIVKDQLPLKWIGGVRFESALDNALLQEMSKAGCQKLVFGLESYNQRVLDLMKKGTKADVVKRVLDGCLKAGISFHLYIIIGFPTEKEQEAMETLEFVTRNEYLTSLGYSCLPSLFGMEKDSPITLNPAEYGLRSLMAPKNEDLGLGYFYEVEEGMSPGEAERMYQYAIKQLSNELCPFPYNYSMSDGLLYIVYKKQNETEAACDFVSKDAVVNERKTAGG